MSDVVRRGRFLGVTEEERAASNARIIAHLRMKRDARTPEEYKERLLALEPLLTQVATFLEVDYRTLLRWCKKDGKGPPGSAWVTLKLWEEKTEGNNG